MCGACLGWGEKELETLQHIYVEPQMCASALVGITSLIKSSCPFGLCVALVVVRARRTSTITHNGPFAIFKRQINDKNDVGAT